MRYQLLGSSGLRVSELCLGTMTFGEEWGFGAPLEDCRAMLDTFRAAGGNFLDTANLYTNGASESILGELIAAERQRWVLATKYTLATRADDPNGAGNSRKNLKHSVEASLQRLRTDCIDLLWVHAWDSTTSEDEVMRSLDDLVRAGKVLYIGVSDTPAWVVSRCNTLAELRGWSRFIGLQIEYSLIERTVERELTPMAKALDLGVLAWGPIGAGVLSGKYTRGDAAAAQDSKRADTNQRRGRLTPQRLAIAKEVDAVADELGRSSTQVALNWLRQRSQQVIPIVGARHAAQLRDSLGCLEFRIPDEQLARLDQASAVELGFPHQFLQHPDILNIVYGDTRERLQLR